MPIRFSAFEAQIRLDEQQQDAKNNAEL